MAARLKLGTRRSSGRSCIQTLLATSVDKENGKLRRKAGRSSWVAFSHGGLTAVTAVAASIVSTDGPAIASGAIALVITGSMGSISFQSDDVVLYLSLTSTTGSIPAST